MVLATNHICGQLTVPPLRAAELLSAHSSRFYYFVWDCFSTRRLRYTSYRKGRERLAALLLNGGVPQENDVAVGVAPVEE